MSEPLDRPGLASLFSTRILLIAWLPAALVTLAHYVTGPELHWLHDVLRRLYYLPILFAAFSHGLRGGLLMSLAVAAAYSPHAFTHLMHRDPAHTLEKALELLLYLVVGAVAGILVDRERRRRQQLHQALEEQRRTADQLVRAGRLAALGEMVAGIAHELKNPLHALRGTAEVVDGAVAGQTPERRMWELHRKEIDRLEQVAERFLSFARPTPPERRDVDLRQVVERTTTLVAAQARQHRVELVVEPADVATCRVQADEPQLVQVLLNITLNALQALGERARGGTVRFSLGERRRGEAPYRVITVSNDGPPVPEADLERIFDPFVTSKPEGAGLGLSIASRIVEGHGGFIEVRNLEEARGVELAVWLPAYSVGSRLTKPMSARS